MHKLALGAAALTLLAGTAFAQTATTFADVDTDTNGELSFEELVVVWPDFTQDEFTAADLDMSGGLNVDELNALQPAAAPAVPEAPAEMPAQ